MDWSYMYIYKRKERIKLVNSLDFAFIKPGSDFTSTVMKQICVSIKLLLTGSVNYISYIHIFFPGDIPKHLRVPWSQGSDLKLLT